MNEQIICAIMTLIGVIFSAVISFFISKHNSKKEFEILWLKWDHEIKIEISNMCSNIGNYYDTENDFSRKKALNQIRSVRAKLSNKALSQTLKKLEDAVRSRNFINIETYLEIFYSQIHDPKKRNIKNRKNKKWNISISPKNTVLYCKSPPSERKSESWEMSQIFSKSSSTSSPKL